MLLLGQRVCDALIQFLKFLLNGQNKAHKDHLLNSSLIIIRLRLEFDFVSPEHLTQ